jgi:AraC family cel operon transcriptional repressor
MNAKYVQLDSITSDCMIGNDMFFLSGFSTPHYHYHDFFEITFISAGSITMNVNYQKILISKNSIVFIRPSDIHYKTPSCDSEYFSFGFRENILFSLFDYLGDAANKDVFLSPQISPVITINNVEASFLLMRLKDFDNDRIKGKYITLTSQRIFLIDIISFFLNNDNKYNTNPLPEWLSYTIRAMKNQKHYIEGISAVLRISQKSQSYLCRAFKKYLHLTPVQFINDLRLSHAANLLINTNLDILSISLDSGFDNLSHFYHLFQQKYGKSPKIYRIASKDMVTSK